MKKTIDLSNLTKNDVIAVAVSGGKDSIALLHYLYTSQKDLKITVKAVNIDHQIRGQESKDDSLFVENYCRKFGIPLKSFIVDAPLYSAENGYTLEQGARILRYNIFNEVISSGFANKIATAHHKNDNFESVLFNLFRGTSLKGTAGISPIKNAVIRPLLNTTREEIEEYVSKHNLPFVTDSTNFDTDLTRNYIRHEIFPKIVNKFPDCLNAVKRFSDTAREENEFLNELSASILKFEDNGVLISVSAHPVLIKRATVKALNHLGVTKDYLKEHLNAVANLVSKENGTIITLKNNVMAVREYNYIRVCLPANENYEFCINYSVCSFKVGNKKYTLSTQPHGLFFDGDKIPQTAVIRTRREGDVFTKFGGGTKKLKDYLIDKKIPALLRDEIPLIADGNNVLVIFGVEISDFVKTNEHTKNKIFARFDKNDQ